ncbi:hypothetical protein BS78_04G234300 [Paspalum vaginatum]|nr:hypothetical protein BS78_04G234300 [Paspalum vaginatum]
MPVVFEGTPNCPRQGQLAVTGDGRERRGRDATRPHPHASGGCGWRRRRSDGGGGDDGDRGLDWPDRSLVRCAVDRPPRARVSSLRPAARTAISSSALLLHCVFALRLDLLPFLSG